MNFIRPLLFIVAISSASAYDQAAFGNSLNGWGRDGSARYSLDGARYRTLKPVETVDATGNAVLKVTVIHLANSWAEVPYDLELVFSQDGVVQSARITGSPRGQKVDTGVISRPAAAEAAPPAKDGDGKAVAVAEPVPLEPVAEMRKALFASLESQVSAAAEAKEKRKRDLITRVAGPEPVDAAAVSAGLRYNFDLLLGLSKSSRK